MEEMYFRKCIDMAKKAAKFDEVPVGAVIVKNGKILSFGYNKKESSFLCTRHAEIEAIEKANKKIKSWRLDDCVMYVTLEPCLMCCGAILESRIEKVIYLIKQTNVLYKSDNYINSSIYEGDLNLKEEYLKILHDFFENKRK